MRYFTKQQIEDIRKQLATLGVKDSDFPETSALDGEEYVVVVQDGSNYKVKIKDLFSEYVTEDIIEHITQGKSAYDIAVEKGFTGSIDDWLDSLQGPPGEPGVASATATLVDDGGNPSVDVIKVGNRLDFRFNNTVRGGGDTPVTPEYVLPPANSGALGGIKIGRGVQNSREYPVELDASNRAFVRVPWTDTGGDDTPSTPLQPAGYDTLGGIKTGYQTDNENRRYGIRVDSYANAYVTVPWTGEGGSGGTNGGHWENAFAAVAEGISPGQSGFPVLPNEINDNNTSSAWKHYAPDNENGTLVIWMATRWVDGNGDPGNWQGPWRVSGPGGENGLDGDTLEFIYTRTNNETDPIPSLTNSTPDSSKPGRVPSDDDFVPSGWKDNAAHPDIQINATNRVMWMAFRVKTSSIDPVTGDEVRAWSSFAGPFMWSVWGRQGTDGDGVEYIFYAGTTLLSQYLPNTWNINTVGYNSKTWEDREFRMNGQQGNWHDDPVDLDDNSVPQGTKQWVCIRRKYADNAANRSNYTASQDANEPYWHAYSAPALWGYKGKDGDAGIGVVGDLSNEVIAVPLDGSGHVAVDFSQQTRAIIYNGAAEVTPSSITIDSIKDSAGNTYQNNAFNGGNGLITIAGATITAAIRSTDNFSLENKSLNVVLNLTAAVTINNVTTNVTRSATLTLVGVHFGDDGSSYSLETSTTVIRHSQGIIEPSAIDVSCLRVRGLEPLARYTAESSSLAQLNASVDQNFYFKYKIGDEGALIDLTTASLSTSNISDYVTFYLYYGTVGGSTPLLLVDQETIYVITDGITPGHTFKSIVFKRSSSQPATPGTSIIPTGSDPADSNGITNRNYGGTYINPVPYGWSDGIPAYNNAYGAEFENTLWMCTRVFVEGEDSTLQTLWTAPSIAVDGDCYDIEFAYMQPNDATPPMPTDDPNGNRHGGQGTQIWFDPVADALTADWEEMVWRAESYARNGEPKNWVITRIVGENGTPGDNAIYLDLDNENDALLYRGDGTRIPIDVTSTAILYNGGIPVNELADYHAGDVVYSINAISQTNNANNVTASINSTTGVITVTGMTTAKGWVRVRAAYKQRFYYAVLSLVKIVGNIKYDIITDPTSLSYNESTEELTPEVVHVYVYAIGEETDGRQYRRLLETIPTGMTLLFDGDPIPNGIDDQTDWYYYNGVGGTLSAIDLASVSNIPVGLYNSTTTFDSTTVLDYETIPIGHISNGTPGVGLVSEVTVYAISSSGTTIPSSFPYNDAGSIPSTSQYYGYWVWARTTKTYSNNTTNVTYMKWRIASDGTSGLSTGIVYRGVYDSQESYYGDSARTDIVYYPPTLKYYRANPGASSSPFTNQAPVINGSVNLDYWMEFGENFDNIATGFLFAESAEIEFLEGQRILLKDSNGTITGGAQGGNGINFWAGATEANSANANFRVYNNGRVVMNEAQIKGGLQTVDSNGKGITINNNILSATDSNGDVRLNVSGDPISVGTPAVLYAPLHHVDTHNFSVHYPNTADVSGLTRSFELYSGINIASGAELFVPALSIGIEHTDNGYGGSEVSALYIRVKNASDVTVKTISYSGSIPSTSGTNTITTSPVSYNDLAAGTYKVVLDYEYGYDLEPDQYYTYGYANLTVSDDTIGNVSVVDSSARLVQIGSNGLSVNLGGSFSAVFALDTTTNPNTQRIELLGPGGIGLRVTISGVEVNNGSGWGRVVTQ